MPKPKFPYAGDAILKRLLERYHCPAPFHVVRMRFWGEIVSPSFQASPIKTIESFWPNGLPTFDNGDEANAFFQALMGLWNISLQPNDRTWSRRASRSPARSRAIASSKVC
jgi:hypothetical protein